MSILEICHLTHIFGEQTQPLYKDASLELYKGEHMGVIGQNGVGKSTLIKILMGEVIPDEGEIRWQPGTHIGYLNQYAQIDSSLPIVDYLKTAFMELYALENELEAIYKTLEGSYSEDLLLKAGHLQGSLEEAGFYTLDSRINTVVTGLGIDAIGTGKPVRELSGGQRSKVILAKLLLEESDVLVLDEPTNFLDQEHVAWLADTLSGMKCAYLVVSHDFDFLGKISTCICDIEFGRMKKYNFPLAKALELKGQHKEDYIRMYQTQQLHIRRTEEFIRRNKAGIKSKMARGRQKHLDRMERLEAPKLLSRPGFTFQYVPQSGQEVLLAENLVIGYGHALLPPIDLSIKNGEKVVVAGFNGIGKSTLLKTLIGELPPLSGGFFYADNSVTGYYEQDRVWLDKGMTPLGYMNSCYPLFKQQELRKWLARCGIMAEDVEKPLSQLSGGEQSKVRLCELMMSPWNILLLDEPTNHLDAQAKDALKQAILEFEGTVIMVSHERDFYAEWVDRVINIEKWITYSNPYPDPKQTGPSA